MKDGHKIWVVASLVALSSGIPWAEEVRSDVSPVAEVDRLVAAAHERQHDGRSDLAEEILQQAVTIVRNSPDLLPVLGPDVLGELGLLYESQGRLADAEAVYGEARHVLGGLEVAPEGWALLAHRLARVYLQQRRYQNAEPLYLELVSLWEEVAGPESAEMAGSLHNLGEIYRLTDRFDLAETTHQRGLAVRRELFGERSIEAAEGLRSVAVVLTEAAQFERAEPLLWDALNIYQENLGPESPLVLGGLEDLITLYRAQGASEQASPLEQRATALRDALRSAANEGVEVESTESGVERERQR